MIRTDGNSREWMIVAIVRDFLRSYVDFARLREQFKARTLHFEDIDTFISDKKPELPLYRLKESCHALFREPSGTLCSDEEKLLDLAVGSIFHEAMKIRENLYQLEVYKPHYTRILTSRSTTKQEQKLLFEFVKIGTKAERRLSESLSETHRLFVDTLKYLGNLLTHYRNNHVLVRFLLQNIDLLETAFGKKGGRRVLEDLFPGGLGEAFEMAGKSYLDSEYYDQAADFFRKGLQYRRGDTTLRYLYLYARGMAGYYNNRYDNTLRYFSRFLRFAEFSSYMPTCLRKIEEVCRQMVREYVSDKKGDLAKIPLELAERAHDALTRLPEVGPQDTIPPATF